MNNNYGADARSGIASEQKLADKGPTEIEKFIDDFQQVNSQFSQNVDWLYRICCRLINEPSKPIDKESRPEPNGHLSMLNNRITDYRAMNMDFSALLQRLDKII